MPIYNRLTDRQQASGVTLNDIIHVVITSDQTQSPQGSSFYAPLSFLQPILSGASGTSGTSGSSGISGLNGIDGSNSRRWGGLNTALAPNIGGITFRNVGGSVTLDPSLIANIRANEIDSGGSDMTNWFNALDSYTSTNVGKAYVQITDSFDQTIFGIYEVGNVGYNVAGYWQIGTTLISSSAPTYNFSSTILVTLSWVLFGADGTSGVNGTSGSSGTSGMNGTSGTSGTSGVNGTSGTSGSSGTSSTTAQSVLTVQTTVNSSFYPTFVDSDNVSPGQQESFYTNDGLSYNPSTNTLDVTGSIENGDGSGDFPSYSFISDTNTGIYRVGTDNIGIATGGVLRLSADSNGRVLIGNGNESTGSNFIFPIGNSAQTADNTPTTLLTLSTTTNNVYTVEVFVAGKDLGSQKGVGGVLTATFVNDTGVLTLVGTAQGSVQEDFGSPSPTFTLVNSGTDIILEVTGVVATDILWYAKMRYLAGTVSP